MGFAEDEVKKYIQKNYDKFFDIRVSQMLYLPCLTTADREEIKCSTKNDGNSLSVIEFFHHLYSKRGWVTHLISALRKNNSDLADVIQEVYDAALLPSQRRPPTSSPSAVAQVSRSSVSVPLGLSAPPSDDPPLSPPRSQSGSPRDQPPKFINASTPAPSASCQDVVDYRSPVQETKCPSQNNKTTVEGKALEKDVRQKISTPGQHSRNAAESDASLTVPPENPTDVQVASPRSPVQNRMHLREASEEDIQSTKPISSRSEGGNLVQNWDGSQHRPVCVKNGYFGNMSRSVESGLSPAPELAAASGLTPSRNQPEEDSYLSSDCSPISLRGREGAQGEEQKIQPLSAYPQEDLLDNPANNNPSLLRMQVDTEQKGAQGPQDSSSNVNTLPLLQKEDDRHSQQVRHKTVDVREMPSNAVPKGSTIVNLQRSSKTVPPSIPSETTASSFEQGSSSVSSEKVSHDHGLCREATPETPQTASSLGLSPSKSNQFPQRSSMKEHVGQVPNTVPVGRFSSLPSDFTGSSSTDVIPPSSPAVGSAVLSDGYLEDLKPPIQEKEPVDTNLRTTFTQVTGDASLRTVVGSSSVMDIPTNSLGKRNNASGNPYRGASVFCSNREEEDISLCKPGILVSGEIARGPLDQQPNNQGREYSGTSARLRISGEYREESDPLMLSGSTRSSRSEDSGRNVSMGANNASLHLQKNNPLDEGSIRTHTVRVQEPPSVDLTGAPEVTRPALENTSQSPDGFLDSVSGVQPIKNANSPSVRSDGQSSSHQNESVNNSAPLYLSGSALLALGFALTSLVALVVYKQLKK